MTRTTTLPTGPRERLLMFGEPALSDAQVIALLLGHGSAGRPVARLAHDLLGRFGGLDRLALAEAREIARVPGIGIARAAAIVAAAGFARRIVLATLAPGDAVRSGRDAARVVREETRREPKEAFYVLLLDTRRRLMAMRMVSVGGLDGAPVHPREVFRPALREGASAILVAHNHPSGDPTPSRADRLVTARLREVGELVGIELLDHLVVGADRYFSLVEDRVLPIRQRADP